MNSNELLLQLFRCVKQHDTQAVAEMIANNTFSNIENNMSLSAAVEGKQTEIVHMLFPLFHLKEQQLAFLGGIETDQYELVKWMHQYLPEEWRGLGIQMAAGVGRDKILRFLLKDTGIDSQHNCNLELAVQHNKEKCVDLLLPLIDTTKPHNALAIATKYGRIHLVEKILTTTPTTKQATDALCAAAQYNHTDIFNLLLPYSNPQSNVNIFRYAVINKNRTMIEPLLFVCNYQNMFKYLSNDSNYLKPIVDEHEAKLLQTKLSQTLEILTPDKSNKKRKL